MRYTVTMEIKGHKFDIEAADQEEAEKRAYLGCHRYIDLLFEKISEDGWPLGASRTGPRSSPTIKIEMQ